jgi:hypothetical protein
MVALGTEHGLVMGDVATILLNADARPAKHELIELHSRLRALGGWTWHLVFCQCVLAELFSEGRHAEDGLAVLASIPTEDRGIFMAPEIHRLEGELRRWLPAPDMDEIERCFQAALALARQRAEKSLELRAATSLARLWRHQGKRAEARELLKPIYDWFTEGLDLRDLKNARALLDELTSTSPGADRRPHGT